MFNHKYKIVKYLNINNYLFSTIDDIKYLKKENIPISCQTLKV